MRALDRKLLRDLWRLKWQMAAIALLVGCGVSVAVMAFSTQKALVVAQRRYYAATRFADLFASATRVPLAVADDLARIDGVTVVDARAVKTGLMAVPGLLRPATARLIALPDDERRALNRIVVVAGRLPDPGRTDEAVALKTFLDAAHVALGERLTMVIAGHSLAFTIVGAALSPEYVYVPTMGPMPDDAHSGVFWAPRAAVEEPAGLGGAFSVVSLALAPGTPERAALDAVDRCLSPYGGAPAYGRADQISHRFQQERIDRMSIMAVVIPPIFLVVAAALVHLVLGRLVDGEREQIGLLKAFGYDDFAAASIYLRMAAAVGLGGALAGGAAGAWLSNAMVATLARYMRFPHLPGQFSWSAFGVSVALSVAAAMAGSLLAVRRAVRLSPAVAMQPPAPASFATSTLDRLRLFRSLDPPTRMITRHLQRFKWRALTTAGGLALSLALLVGSQFMFGAIDEVVDQAYYRARRWTDTVVFAEVRDARAAAEVARLPAVLAVEPYRGVAAFVRGRGRQERSLLLGADDGARLSRALDPHGRALPFLGDSVILSQALAARLRVTPGDLVDIEVTQGRRTRVALPVGAIAQDYAGLTAQISRHRLNRILGDGDLASGAYVIVDQARRAEFYRAVARTPQIVAAGSRDDTVASFRSAISAALVTEMTFFLGFAGVIAFGIAYNVSRIALADRARDLATLEVLGFTPGECAYILSGELIFLALAAVPAGVIGGYALGATLVTAFEQQDFYIPMLITPHAVGVTFAVYFGAVVSAAALVAQRIWDFDLVAVLKTRD